MGERAERLERRLEQPMLVVAALVIPTMILAGANVDQGWKTVASVLNWAIWFAFLAGWFIKLVLVRWGGMRVHTQAAPFFLGLILGDYVVGSLWSLYGPAMQMSTYKIFI